MNGVLWKWTNYYNGWQPRWFVLKDGILSYFRSEAEVNSGSKGSINLSVCDLNVNIYDSIRFEIIIPGEQKYFLKASNTQERQRWIVALGSGKACHTEPEFQMKDRVGDYCLPLKEISFKESELRVYLELMNQKVSSIKSHLSEDKSPDISAINELTSTLNAACDTFLDSLKELVSLTSTSWSMSIPDSPPTHIGSPVFSSLPVHTSARRHRHNSATRHSNGAVVADLDANKCPYLEPISPEHELATKSRRGTNFLIEMPHSFVDWSYRISMDQCISTLDYINSVTSLLNFLDYFEAQPIISLKLDIKANIKKLSLKYGTDEKQYSDLSTLIVKEDAQINSSTIVIRGLQRVMAFVDYFLMSLLKWLNTSIRDSRSDKYEDRDDDDQVLKQMLIDSFDFTMKEKLNWLERGQFKIITQSLPPLARFMCHLLSLDHNQDHTFHRLLTEHRPAVDQLVVDLSNYYHSIGTVNQELSHLFTVAGVDL